MCEECEQYLITALHDTRLELGQTRSLLCRVTASAHAHGRAGRLDDERVFAKHLMVFPASREVAEMDRLCAVLKAGKRAFCVVSLTVKKGETDAKAVEVPAGTVLAVGQRKIINEDADEEEEDDEEKPLSEFKVKLAQPFTINSKANNFASIVPWEKRKISHCPADVVLSRAQNIGLRSASRGVAYFQSGKMTRVQVQSGLRRRKKESEGKHELAKGTVVGVAKCLDHQKNLEEFMLDKRRADLYPEAVLSGREFQFRLRSLESSRVEPGKKCDWPVEVEPPMPRRLYRSMERARPWNVALPKEVAEEKPRLKMAVALPREHEL